MPAGYDPFDEAGLDLVDGVQQAYMRGDVDDTKLR
jgi:hypothetical protein